MREGNFIKITLFYFFVFLLFTLFLLISFRLPLFINQKVLFYRGVLLIFFTLISIFLITILTRKFILKISYETILASLIVSFSVHLVLFVIFPVTFERSVTMYLLNSLNSFKSKSSCIGLTQKEIENYLINEYIIKRKAVNKRLIEQSIIKMISQKNDCINLTNDGKLFLKLSKIISVIYGVKY